MIGWLKFRIKKTCIYADFARDKLYTQSAIFPRIEKIHFNILNHKSIILLFQVKRKNDQIERDYYSNIWCRFLFKGPDVWIFNFWSCYDILLQQGKPHFYSGLAIISCETTHDNLMWHHSTKVSKNLFKFTIHSHKLLKNKWMFLCFNQFYSNLWKTYCDRILHFFSKQKSTC